MPVPAEITCLVSKKIIYCLGMNLKPNAPKERKKKETTSDPIRPEEPVTRSFTLIIYG